VWNQKDDVCFPDALEEELECWFDEIVEFFDEDCEAACVDLRQIEQELEQYKVEMC